MSSLDKLAIRGIRSFDHNELSVMQFYTPLTVIVGHNGSGKTTIIECLKYATTGDLPPNTKGGAFVHDPSIAGTAEVLAQVKLRFLNNRKEKMLVERRLKVTRKKTGGGLTMKTLEGNIAFVDSDRKDKGKRSSLSTKCADLDEEVPTQLGVSKAILENVIFCHQEESNWPLSAPADLKKKFDDIFEATKYTKALDEIKKLRKEQAQEIRVDTEKLVALKTDRERATKLRAQIERLTVKIADREITHADLDDQIRQIADENRKFYEQATKHTEILNKAETLRTQRQLIESHMHDISATTTELSYSDKELKQEIDQHDDKVKQQRLEKDSAERQMADEQDSLAAVERKRSAAQTARGKLEAEKQRHKEVIEYRHRLVRDLSLKHNIPGFDHSLAPAEMDDFVDRLEHAIVAQSNKIDQMKAAGRQALDELQAKITAIKTSQAADERIKRGHAESIRSTKQAIEGLRSKVDSSTVTQADLNYQATSLADESKRKKDAEAQLASPELTNKLAEYVREFKAAEEHREELHTELASLNAQADVRAKLSLKRAEASKKEDGIQALVDKHSAVFTRLTRKSIDKTTMEAEVNGVLSQLSAEQTAAERSATAAAKELQAVETKVSFIKDKLEAIQADIADHRTRISSGTSSLDVQYSTVKENLDDAEAEVEAARNQVVAASRIGEFFANILAAAKKQHVCEACTRPLDDQELAELERHAARRTRDAPAKLQQAKDELKQWEEQLATLRELLPLETELTRLVEHDLPDTEKAAAELQTQLAAATAHAEEAQQTLSEVKDKLEDVQSLKRSAVEVTRLCRETDDLKREVTKLESELSATGSTATSDEIQAQLSVLQDKIRTIKKASDEVTKQRTGLDKLVATLSNSIHAAEMDLEKKRQELKDKDRTEQQIEEERDKIVGIEAQVKEIEQRMAASGAPLKREEDALAAKKAELAQAESAAEHALRALTDSSQRLENNKKEIQSYRGDGELEKSTRELEQHEDVIVATKAKIANLQQFISTAIKIEADSTAILRNLRVNQQLREARVKIQQIDDEIEGLNEAEARKSARKYNEQYHEKRQKQTDLQSEQAKVGGEISTMRADLDLKKDELKTEYDQIEFRYKKELIRVKTAEIANKDLEKYHKALDAAIMAFHGAKMQEINDTIAELWTKTYQGTDIDKIAIKSDAEGKTAAGRSYNYRVVMYKDTTEMDMRGRCSAGQKVLASIIIRLALADSFGASCGILALDEPTTNLDQDNIAALGVALSDLIKVRKEQSNFQLIVITHDEDFLEKLSGSGELDKYWRVVRDINGATSTIERQRLT